MSETELTAELLARFEQGVTWFVVHSPGLTIAAVQSYVPSGLVFQVYEGYPVFYVGMPLGGSFSEPDYVIGRLGSGLHASSHHTTFHQAAAEATTVITERYMDRESK